MKIIKMKQKYNFFIKKFFYYHKKHIKMKYTQVQINKITIFFHTGTENRIFKRGAMKNSIHYSKQNTAKALRVIAALVSLGQQTSHSCNRFVSPLVM